MGSWGTLGPALLSPAGVALGAGGSLFGQYLVSRGEPTDASALREPQVRLFDAAYDDMWPGHRRVAGVSTPPR